MYELFDAHQCIGEVRALFEEYAESLGIDLSFQGFAAELQGLPGDYAPPRGALLLATVDGDAAGCIALRLHDATRCEMKRLYVRPRFRKLGLGRHLVAALIDRARCLGYQTLLLDTLAHMRGAIRLYESFGFQPTSPYNNSPRADALYFSLCL